MDVEKNTYGTEFEFNNEVYSGPRINARSWEEAKAILKEKYNSIIVFEGSVCTLELYGGPTIISFYGYEFN